MLFYKYLVNRSTAFSNALLPLLFAFISRRSSSSLSAPSSVVLSSSVTNSVSDFFRDSFLARMIALKSFWRIRLIHSPMYLHSRVRVVLRCKTPWMVFLSTHRRPTPNNTTPLTIHLPTFLPTFLMCFHKISRFARVSPSFHHEMSHLTPLYM